jgi:hypothetical protein
MALFLLQGLLGTVLAPLLAARKGHRRREWLVLGLMLGVLAVPFAMSLKPVDVGGASQPRRR